MTFDLVRIYHEMGLFAKGVALALTVMAIASLAVFVERLWAFRRARRRSQDFGEVAATLLEKNEYEALIKRADDYKGSPLAQMIATALGTYVKALRRASSSVSPVELVRRELGRRAEAQAADVRRGLSTLASVGSVAPFVGLLGTVVGIIAAFQGIAKEGSGGLGAVSAGIAEALVVTAFGLLVAIPAVLAFNYLSGKADQILSALEQSRGELIDLLETGVHPPHAHKHEEQPAPHAMREARVEA